MRNKRNRSPVRGEILAANDLIGSGLKALNRVYRNRRDPMKKRRIFSIAEYSGETVNAAACPRETDTDTT